MRPFFTTAVLLVAVLSALAGAHAQTAWSERFEGTTPTWHDAGGDAKYRVLKHERLQQNAHSGNGCEWLQIEGNSGSSAYFSLDVGQPRIIAELEPSVWIKSDRPGPHLALRVVLPRTIDPRSGRPVVMLLMGPAYTDVGRWQRLQLSGIPTLLTRQVHLLRVQFGPQVDDREAYLDAVLLNAYGGPGMTNLWIDDLEIAGHAAATAGRPHDNTAAVSQASAASWNTKETDPLTSGTAPLKPVRLPPVDASTNGPLLQAEPSALPPVTTGTDPAAAMVSVVPAVAPTPRRTVKLVGSVLLVNGRPMFPRVIQHRGEPLPVLKRMGFNAVWLQRLPTPELFEEADRLGLWLICPPPRDMSSTEIASTFDSVLAWDLGNDLTEADLEPTARWEKEVRAADRRTNRPLICRPRTDLRGFSRVADLLLIDRRPLGTSLELTEYATWVRRQPLLARPGTPVWTTVQTQPNESLRQQLLAMEPGSAPPLTVSPEQMRLLVYTAVASGSRGLLFLSDSPLDSPDAETQQRAMSLELLNLELELMEPWAAAGNLVASAESNAPEVVGTVLRTERARLLLPIWSAPMSQCVPPQSAANALGLVAPGVPEASEAYELTPSGVQPLRYKRVAGGLRVVLDEFGMTSQILLAHDPVIVSEVFRRAAQDGRRAAQLQRDLAVRKLNTVQTLAGQLTTRIPVPAAAGWLDSARKSLQLCDSQLSAGDAPGAALNAQRATRSLRLVERAYWDVAVKGLSSPVTSPGAVSFDTLPFHLRLVDRLASSRFGPSRIAGGDFEDLDTMMRAGWRFIQHSPPNVQTTADLAPDAARSGRLGLRLAAVAIDPKNSPAVVETPPVLFSSPPVQVEAGQVVCVYGWVNIASPITGSTDGLLIVDSLAGEPLADRIGKTDGWRQFVLYRVAPQSGAMCVTFALSGMGEAHIDDVAIQVVEGPAAVSRR